MPFTLGTISHGTLRTEDLLEAFADELESHLKAETVPCAAFCVDYDWRADYARMVKEAREIDPDSDEASCLVNEELIDALNVFCPPYVYFGTHEGDGSDFGFWIDFDSLNEDRQSSGEIAEYGLATDEERETLTGLVCDVSDHGNVTLYSAQNGKLTELWSCV